jgi:hypothetical protein
MNPNNHMGKHSKLKPTPPKPPTAPKPPARASPDEVEQVDALLSRAAGHLELLLTAAEATMEAGEASPALARESANVAAKLVAISTEQRQRARQKEAALRRITMRDVMAWLRTQDPDVRSKVARELAGLDNEGSVLS